MDHYVLIVLPHYLDMNITVLIIALLEVIIKQVQMFVSIVLIIVMSVLMQIHVKAVNMVMNLTLFSNYV